MSNNKTDGTGCPVKKTSIGGQALIEGIMMRGPKKISMAVRNPDGEMIVESWDNNPTERPGFFRWPFLRGIFGFIDSMKFGYKCLMRSAEIAGLDELTESTDKKSSDEKAVNDAVQAAGGDITPNENAVAPAANVDDCDNNSAFECADSNVINETDNTSDEKVNAKKVKKSDKDGDTAIKPWVMNTIMIVSSILGVVLALVLFKALPETVYGLFLKLVPALDGKTGYGYSLIRALFVGVLKIVILVCYMLLVSLMKDIKRTFMYHGAEHKSIMCYEKGLELTVENVRMQKRFHPRCGTSFLILMVLVGIFITMFIPTTLHDNEAVNVILRTLISLALLPLMMSLGYELIKLAGKHDNMFTRIVSAPGLWLQRITTKEPEDSMIECAITALKNVIPDDGSDDWSKK